MNEPLALIAARWRAAARAAMVVEIIGARGSVPRDAGTRMLVAADEVAGTIGGGHLELMAIERARQRLAAGTSAAEERRVALGPALGQCCGGSLTLRMAPLAADDPARWPAPAERFFLHLYGAGHVGRAIVRLLEGIACRVQWIDEREAQFPAGGLPRHIERLCVDTIEAEVAQAPAGACYLVMTHSHDLDLAITEAILRRGDFAYAGVIGSASKWARFCHRFAARGLPPEAVARVTCPIGLPGIEGKEPEVIAVAVVAQLLALRR